ncbi:putative xyloglucan endotransglucosylase/hydrolase protein [Trifolium repens]|nr:putative xyloglucan endotransglucosylase/hydrolase protein [Trifolium repens]
MKLYTTLWNGESWATRGGQVKLDWSKTLFMAGFRNFNINACIPIPSTNGGENKGLSGESRKKHKEIYSKLIVYDYCRDFICFARGLPYECRNRLTDFPNEY